mmetsp:Transcript_10906/g.29183  ORF Transcript_10906/g.29183 Transcript_10906/m.29183 type:complete len:454 (-) Transcript_10906:62-1423(-)
MEEKLEYLPRGVCEGLATAPLDGQLERTLPANDLQEQHPKTPAVCWLGQIRLVQHRLWSDAWQRSTQGLPCVGVWNVGRHAEVHKAADVPITCYLYRHVPQRHLPMHDVLGVAVRQRTRNLGTAVQGVVPGQAVASLSRQHLLHAHISTILEGHIHITLALQHTYATDNVWVVQGVRQEAELLVYAFHLLGLGDAALVVHFDHYLFMLSFHGQDHVVVIRIRAHKPEIPDLIPTFQETLVQWREVGHQQIRDGIPEETSELVLDEFEIPGRGYPLVRIVSKCLHAQLDGGVLLELQTYPMFQPPRVTCQLHQHAIRPKAVEPVMPHHQVTKVGLGQLGIQPIWKLHQEDDRVGMRRPEIVQKACHVPLLFPRPVYGYDQHDLVLLHYLGDAFQLRLSNSDSPSCDGRCEHVDWLLLRAPRHQGPEAKCRRAWCDTDEICLHNPLGRTECCHDV